jgi:hypothetical protein
MLMHKVLTTLGILCLALSYQHAWCLGKLDISGIAELQAVYSDAADNWLDGGFSKTRYDTDSFPLRLGKLGLHADYHLTDTLWLRTLTLLYWDAGLEAELIESYFHYRPVPSGPLRLRAKLGAFHAPLSLENVEPAWSSRYGATPSVINAWVGEDLRTIGAEISLDWPGRFRQSAHGWKLTGAVFAYNDANGAILAQRGWAAHDRQTGLFSPLREPTLVAGTRREVYPFYENDDRPGYYLAGEWTWQDRFNLQFFHYDNLAQTGVARGGQSGWRTDFRQLAVQWKPARAWTLMGQAMLGNTRAVNPATGAVFDADFRSLYILANKLLDKHSLSARVEYFDVDDGNRTAPGASAETGRALMLSWHYLYSAQLRFGAEWLLQDSNRRERLITTGRGSELIRQLLFTIQYRFQL